MIRKPWCSPPHNADWRIDYLVFPSDKGVITTFVTTPGTPARSACPSAGSDSCTKVSSLASLKAFDPCAVRVAAFSQRAR
jgi:hypothetical protein